MGAILFMISPCLVCPPVSLPAEPLSILTINQPHGTEYVSS